jgi:large subunit ribosomal protein L6
MSRIGKLPITVPSGVDVAIDGRTVTVKGPKGTLSHTLIDPITIDRADDGTLQLRRPNDERPTRPCTACPARWCRTSSRA